MTTNGITNGTHPTVPPIDMKLEWLRQPPSQIQRGATWPHVMLTVRGPVRRPEFETVQEMRTTPYSIELATAFLNNAQDGGLARSSWPWNYRNNDSIVITQREWEWSHALENNVMITAASTENLLGYVCFRNLVATETGSFRVRVVLTASREDSLLSEYVDEAVSEVVNVVEAAV